ncbi:4424_t:CDS:2 [Ambispora leptoticha]|uniref:4424_t:CDS:1 n=1 Tax=Ambispora leptoticha TaxID=144679 RepID=A0A9N8VND8_9GLOM|nr:4424_t:CDS:2 [Ambispora leptoticha]
MVAEEPPVDDQELYSSWALLIQTSLLVGALWTSYYLQIKKIRAIHETVVSIFAGMFVGLIIRLSPGSVIQKMDNFFRNFGTILTFALVGTFISALVTGFLVAFLGLIGIVALSFLDSMIFGAILSATDPVTVLAIFQTFKVDPKLYSVIFGESILNDAVAILHKYPPIESCMIGLIAYNSYFLSNGLQMSGIVSLLFCGITLKHYAYDNMSLRTKRTTKYMFRVMAQLSENFIFIYLGLTLFTMNLEYKPAFIFFTMIIICVSRYCAVFPLSNLINAVARYRKRAEHLPHAHQVMLFWAGLRGAVAFALSAGLVHEMRTTILVVVVLSVIVFGGTTSRMLEILRIRTGVEDEDSGDSDYEDSSLGGNKYDAFEDVGHHRHLRSRGTNGNTTFYFSHSPENSLGSDDSIISIENNGLLTQSSSAAARAKADQAHWFISFDNRFLKPLFSRHNSDQSSPAKEQWRHENLIRRGVVGGGLRVHPSSGSSSDNSKTISSAAALNERDVGDGGGNNGSELLSIAGTKFELPPIDSGSSFLNIAGVVRSRNNSTENLSLRSITPVNTSNRNLETSTSAAPHPTNHDSNNSNNNNSSRSNINHERHVSDDDEKPLLDLSSNS